MIACFYHGFGALYSVHGQDRIPVEGRGTMVFAGDEQRRAMYALMEGPEALAAIRRFEQRRHAFALLDDAAKPDKRTTIFVNSADLVWAWFADGGSDGLWEFMATHVATVGGELESLWRSSGRSILADYVDAYDATDPPQVALIDADGGLRF